MDKKVTMVVVVLLLGAIGVYFLVDKQNDPAELILSPSPTTETSTIAETETVVTTSSDDSVLHARGTSYADPQGVFTVVHPPDYIVDSPAENHIRIFKRAETERPQGEISDGAMVVIESVNLEGKTLEEYVDERIKTATENGLAEVVKPKQSMTVGEYPAFSYTLSGQGNSPQTVMQKNADSDFAVVLTTLVEDPQDAGYQKQVDAIISTIELLK